MWSDNETTVDYLNFGVVADACAKLLQQARGTPISVGVSGGWGVGKTSLVRMIEGRLSGAATPGENTYVVVTFNPWLYQDFEGARSALGTPEELRRRGICVRIVLNAGAAHEIKAICQMRSVREKERRQADNPAWLLGLEFVEMSAEHRRFLKELCVKAVLNKNQYQ